MLFFLVCGIGARMKLNSFKAWLGLYLCGFFSFVNGRSGMLTSVSWWFIDWLSRFLFITSRRLCKVFLSLMNCATNEVEKFLSNLSQLSLLSVHLIIVHTFHFLQSFLSLEKVGKQAEVSSLCTVLLCGKYSFQGPRRKGWSCRRAVDCLFLVFWVISVMYFFHKIFEAHSSFF